MSASLTVLIPAYNEQDNLAQAFDDLECALKDVVDDYEIIVIDDGSKDHTLTVAQDRMRQDARIKCVRNDRNMGYGYSYWRGVGLAGKDYVGVFPADNDMCSESFRNLAEHIGRADILSAYLQNPHDRDWLRRTLSKIFVVVMNAAFNTRLKYFNGPFIARREILQPLTIKSTGLTILAECKVRLIREGRSYLEVPFTHIPRRGGRSSALQLKSIKAAIGAVSLLYLDIYWGNNGLHT